MGEALALWWKKGADRTYGGFHDALDMKTAPANAKKRGRVQGRQSWVYALAGSMEWNGPWAEATRHGLDFILGKHRREDGQISTLLADDGTVLDPTATLYDQTFFLLALSEASKLLPERPRYVEAAHRLLDTILKTRRHPGGGFLEHAPCPFQSNPHMHLLEAALAWRDVEPDEGWDRVADEIAQLALTCLIDGKTGSMREFFDASWQPLTGASSVEPGHQFEWAWLLGRWAKRRGHGGAHKAALRLFEIGSLGSDPRRGVAMDELRDDFTPVRATARLWPQTERIKAALAFMAESEGTERERYRAEAHTAASALWRYLEMPVKGLWRDRMLGDGSFVDEPAPASSLYHIICAIRVMRECA
ncbi:MAG: AGE family epimerase/isomerase [Rhizomicrobium sp.]